MTKRAFDLFLFAAPLVLVACSDSGNHKADAWVDDDAPVDRPIFLDSPPAIDANNVVDADGTKLDGSRDACPNLAGAYKLTTEIVSTTCKVGLNVITQPDTYTFTQTAPSCQFTMTNSIYTGPIYAGHFAMAGSQAKVIWDSVTPAPTAATYAITYTSEDLTITPGTTVGSSTIVGTFTWHSAAGCDGTTNVCNGSVPAGCPTPQ